VLQEIGEIPDDILDDVSEENYDKHEIINKNDDTNGDDNDENESEGRGNYDYDVEDLLDEFFDTNEDE
jgi:hypothetical protein